MLYCQKQNKTHHCQQQQRYQGYSCFFVASRRAHFYNCAATCSAKGKTHLLYFLESILFFHPVIIVVSHLEVVDLHEGLVRVEGVFDRGGARLTDLTGAPHVRPARNTRGAHEHVSEYFQW